MSDTTPVTGNLTVYTDTDNPFDFPITDEDGTRLDVTGWTADLEVDTSSAHAATKLVVSASVVVDPDDAAATVLRVNVTDDLLQPGTSTGQWPVTTAAKKYPYSLKRTNAGFEKILRLGNFIVKRARV